MSLGGQAMTARLVEVPSGYENGGDFSAIFDGISLNVAFGEDEESPCISFEFNWVRSFRYISEASF